MSALHLRPNDLLHRRAIEWARAGGLTKYGLGGTSLFLGKFGGEVMPKTRHRPDRSPLRQSAIGDWMADKVEEIRPFVPPRMVGFGRSLRDHVKKLHYYASRRSG